MFFDEVHSQLVILTRSGTVEGFGLGEIPSNALLAEEVLRRLVRGVEFGPVPAS